MRVLKNVLAVLYVFTKGLIHIAALIFVLIALNAIPSYMVYRFVYPDPAASFVAQSVLFFTSWVTIWLFLVPMVKAVNYYGKQVYHELHRH